MTIAISVSGVFFACAAEEAEVRDTLTIAISAEPESLDPVKMTSARAATVGEHVIERLIYMEEDGSLVPMLATDWSANEDSTVWTFQIRQGVTFHDGEPLNAEAVRLNLARFVNPEVGAAYAFLLGSVREIRATGEYTLELQLARPFAPILSHLSHSFIGILSPSQIRDIAPTATIEDPIGTGPYKMERWNRGDSVRLTINDDYWGPAPQIPNLVFNFIPEESARIVALETGEADAIMAVPPADVARLGANEDIDVVFQTSVRTIYIGLNNLKAPFNNPIVRRALNHAVNKQAIVDSIFEGSGFVADAPIVDAMFGHTSVGPYEYDPDLARRLLAEVGIDARLETREWSAYLQFTAQPPNQAEHDALLLGWGTVTLDADYGLYALLHSAQWNPNGNNRGFYKNERVDELLSAARMETNPERRRVDPPSA